jgi:hypothetical protein
MAPIMLPDQPMFRSRINHDIERLAEILKPSK